MPHTKFHRNRPRFQRRFLKGFYHKWAWRPSWSCDPDAASKLSFLLHKEAALMGQAVSEKMFEIVDDVRTPDERTDAGALLYYKLTYKPLARVS